MPPFASTSTGSKKVAIRDSAAATGITTTAAEASITATTANTTATRRTDHYATTTGDALTAGYQPSLR